MKTSSILLLAVWSGAVANAFALGLSETNHGIYVVVASWDHRSLGYKANPFSSVEPFRFDNELMWSPFCESGKVELCYPGPPQLARLHMTGPDGKAVPKTRLGETFGTKFDRIRYEDTVHGWSRANIEAQGPYDSRGGGFTGPILPAPAKLFQMKKPGVYTLEVQMQLLRAVWVTNHWTYPVVRFSPIRIKVEKPSDTQSGRNG
ncbi:MAG TPA: hypothetical protein PKI20_21015 [Verrucomicrobiota bacterium]|nr:hypothetical protein [Verrucomicrobiota bacterium]HQL80389.1 hypothetical protein [Verrucomicrobiota bacterium]